MSQSIDVNLESALRPLKVALVQSNLLKHKDKDVRLLVAACISEVMRIVAPDAPYDDETLKVYFILNRCTLSVLMFQSIFSFIHVASFFL